MRSYPIATSSAGDLAAQHLMSETIGSMDTSLAIWLTSHDRSMAACPVTRPSSAASDIASTLVSTCLAAHASAASRSAAASTTSVAGKTAVHAAEPAVGPATRAALIGCATTAAARGGMNWTTMG